MLPILLYIQVLRPFWGYLAQVRLPLPRVGQGWVQNPSFTLPQVSNCLDLLHIYFNDIGDIYWAHLGPFYTVFDPFSGGSKHKNRDCARKLQAIAPPFWALIMLTICKLFTLFSPCFAMFCLPERSGDILLLFGSYTRCVHFHCSRLYSHILGIHSSHLASPLFPLFLWGCLYASFFICAQICFWTGSITSPL